MAKRPLSILRFNAAQMKRQGASAPEIDAYLADNGVTADAIMAIPAPTSEQLQKALAYEQSPEFKEGMAKAEELEKQVARRRRNIERLETAQGVARGFGQGLTFGTADELESALTGQDVQSIRAEQREFNREHPVLGVGSEIAGAIANPLGAYGAAGKGASLGAKVARGATTGAVGGALYGFGSGEGGLENRLENAATTGAISGALGAAIPVAVEGVKKAGSSLADIVGLTSGAGGESVKQAYSAGTRGSETFKQAMRGKSDAFAAVDTAETALKRMEQARGQEFANALPKNGNFLLPENAVQKALDEAAPKISGVRAGVDDVAANAYARAQRVFQNVNNEGGFTFNNALEAKQAMDAIIQPLQRAGEKNAVRIIQPIQNAVKETMIDAVPEYGTALAEFSKSSKLIDAIRTAISSGKNPTTELRSLQSLTRSSVAGAQGGKLQLGQALDKITGGQLLDEIAGGQVSQIAPRDIIRGVTGVSSLLRFDPLGVVGVAATSPRVVGETAYKLGQISSALGKLPTVRVPAYGLTAIGDIVE